MDKLKFETPDMVSGNIDKIATLFPSAITEMRGEDGEIKRGVNFEVLKQLLSRDVVDGDECYEFTWVGKKAAMAEAARPITKTLRPVKEDSRDWDTTENLYIEGDNLEVLKLLQESYLGKVKMIYIDPPYNTGSDFIYADDFMRSQEEENEQMGMYDEDENRLFKNTDTNGRFHSDWCSMIYSRLMLARNLLTDDGVVFVSIDDCEMDNLRKICAEVYGEENLLVLFIWKSKGSGAYDSAQYKTEHEYVMAYAKNITKFVANRQVYDTGKDPAYALTDERLAFAGKYKRQALAMGTLSYSPSLDYPMICPDGTQIYPGGKFGPPYAWRYSKDKMQKALENGFAEFVHTKNGWSLFSKQHEKMDGDGNIIVRDKPFASLGIEAMNRNGTELLKKLFNGKIFDYPKPIDLLLFLVKAVPTTNDIVLDFFSGSATTAHAVMQLNAEDGGHRKFIMVQLPEKCDEASEAYKAGYKNICEIGKERIRRAGGKIKAEHPVAQLDTGFRVFRVDESNMEDVYYHPEELTQTMLGGMVSNIKSDRSDLDLLYACLLDWGVEINLPHSVETLDGCTIHNVDDGALVACFNENVPDTVIRRMADLHPLRAVFRDSSFASDDSKINVTEIFKNLSPDTNVKVI